MTEARRLGRGLEALLGPVSRVEERATAGAGTADAGLLQVPVGAIQPNPFQPRRTFDETALTELADSIAASGLLQPVIVRARDGRGSGRGGEGRYELISGERRWRAVQRLGWATIPVVVRQADDQAMLTLALIENLQRDDLSAIDAAVGYKKLIDEFQIPHGEVARLVGKSRAAVSNTLRLLGLPVPVQRMIQEGALSEGHARALLAVTDAREALRLARAVVEGGYSVRDTEALVRGEGPAAPTIRPRRLAKPKPLPSSIEARRVEDALRTRLGTDVRLTARRKGRGTLAISYYSNDDLARLLELILGHPFDG